MALTKVVQTPFASTTLVPSTPQTSAGFAIGYGVSGVGIVTNGGTGPTVGADFVVLCSNDGGSTYYEIMRFTAGLTASATYRFPFSLGVAGANGDWTHYQVQFANNTVQNVTVQCNACSTTLLV